MSTDKEKEEVVVEETAKEVEDIFRRIDNERSLGNPLNVVIGVIAAHKVMLDQSLKRILKLERENEEVKNILRNIVESLSFVPRPIKDNKS